MREQVDAIVEGLQAAFASGKADAQTLDQTVAAITALVPQTEVDQVHHQGGLLRLMNILVEHASPAERESLLAQRAQIVAQFRRRYGSEETPYLRSRAIVENVAARLAAGDDPATTAASALQELEALPFDPEDEAERLPAQLAVNALRAAHDWLAAYKPDPEKPDPLSMSLRINTTALEIGGFDRDVVVNAARTVRSSRLSFDGSPLGHARVLMILLGIGLRANPTALPALDEVRVLLTEALGEVEQAAQTAESARSDFAARCDSILSDLERALKGEGFSEYLLRQASASLQELQPESEDDVRTVRAALVQMLDLAIPHAPPEAAQTFMVSREAIVRQNAAPEPPLDAAGLQAKGEAVLQQLRDDLAAGSLVSPAATRAITELQGLSARVREDDADGAKVLMRMMPEVMAIIAPYAEPHEATLMADVTSTTQQVFGEVENILGDKPAGGEVAAQAVMREMKRLVRAPTSDPWEQTTALPHFRQFSSLLRPWMDRVAALSNQRDESRDEVEAERIAKRAKIANERLRAATTEEQWIEQQRGSFRRVALDLRQFERRHHLMLIEPPWPTASAVVDANAVFFSGTSEVQRVVEAACARIGMAAPVAHGVNDTTHTRWDLLRRSALAVFDFTAYDRAASDPPRGLPRAGEKREAIARAAAPAARVAYEYAWALVLGTAPVIIAREGQTLPFDIDIEPVHLTGDAENDTMNVVLGLQAALLGVQRGLQTTGLTPTLARLRELFGGNAQAAPLLAAIGDARDAMQVQFCAEALLERAGGGRAMLALPSLPPIYPSTEGPPTLFHVTAFRPWSKPCEEIVREASARAGLHYLIGYERLA
ncbi:MAG TPA: hypothetical protein VG095_02030, partial [Chthoniobacterales bacterium]|nr:hypothetical protein [Chthoniobacterales bacterium]